MSRAIKGDNSPKAIRDHVDADDKLTERIVLAGQHREVTVVNESGLYDLIDLKQVISNNLFSDYKFTKAQWENANSIYILSERGYAKLLCLLSKKFAIYPCIFRTYA